MKIRLLSWLLTLALLCALLGGCGGEAAPTQPATGLPTLATTQPATQPTQPTEPEEAPDLFTRCGQGALPAPGAVPAYAAATQVGHLYRCDLGLTPTNEYYAVVNGNMLQVFVTQNTYQCLLFDLTTGQQTGSVELDKYYNWGNLQDGGLWAVSIEPAQVLRCDAAGVQQQISVALPPVVQDHGMVSNVVVSADGRYLAATYDSGRLMKVVDLQSGDITSPTLPEGFTAWFVEQLDGGFLVGNYDTTCCYYDPARGELTHWGDSHQRGEQYHGVFSYYQPEALVLGDGSADAPRLYMDYDEGETLCDVNYGCAITQGKNGVVRAYDLRRQVLLGEVTIPTSGYIATARMLPNGMALIVTDSTQNMYLLDVAALAEQAAEPVSVLYATDEDLLQLTDRLAAQTEKATGVELFYGSQGNDFVIYDYVGVVQRSAYSVYWAVKETSRMLLMYPQGMLRESYQPGYRGLQIYLCDDIYGVQSGSLSTAGGITAEADGYIVVAVDAGGDIHGHLPHELSHVFDRRIQHTDLTTGTTYMDDWVYLTKLAEPYSYSYENYGLYYEYTALQGDGTQPVWFVDDYSRSFPTEDRARVMEHLFHYDTEQSRQIFAHENLLQKGRAYAWILRQCFPSCDTADVHHWETILGPIDGSALKP